VPCPSDAIVHMIADGVRELAAIDAGQSIVFFGSVPV
jgi:hypothetical protein